MTAVIETHGLTKHFGTTLALDGLDLSVDKGTVHGFLGPNGSGKSTTIRILLGLVRATGGRVQLLGKDPWRDAVELHRQLAYVPGDVTLWPNLTGGEAIDLLTRLHGSQGSRNGQRRDELLDRFDLDPTKKGRTYSKGNRQKVALVAALASDAPLLLLDEPTSGLDPLMERVFQDELVRVRDEGRTVMLSSHILSELREGLLRREHRARRAGRRLGFVDGPAPPGAHPRRRDLHRRPGRDRRSRPIRGERVGRCAPRSGRPHGHATHPRGALPRQI